MVVVSLSTCRNVGFVDESEQERSEPLTAPDRDLTPPVMWPDEGSGFEADPFSPAGFSQQVWTATRRRPHSRAGMWTLRIVCLVIALAFIAAQVVH
jgi:hypothetical protein